MSQIFTRPFKAQRVSTRLVVLSSYLHMSTCGTRHRARGSASPERQVDRGTPFFRLWVASCFVFCVKSFFFYHEHTKERRARRGY
ncbi:hypothetical protein VTN00DRAFT_3511 [Thermoascus crustaceus]|uniref:uncharacterized protein n=1 Tax=Thermoascus crustaceus TaxID=5088 RepID=UPI003742E832